CRNAPLAKISDALRTLPSGYNARSAFRGRSVYLEAFPGGLTASIASAKWPSQRFGTFPLATLNPYADASESRRRSKAKTKRSNSQGHARFRRGYVRGYHQSARAEALH